MEDNKRKLARIKTVRDYSYSLNYKETPVDIITFISNDYYLGSSTGQGTTIAPVWKDAMQKIFADNTKLYIVLTGSIGCGKSFIALICISYIMYRMLLLRDPWGYFGLAPSGVMAISFFNLTKTLGSSRGFIKLQSIISRSPWFIKNASSFSQIHNQKILDYDLFQYVLSSPYSKGFGTVGHDVISGVLDEVDSPMESIKQKERVLKVYEATARRFKDRFGLSGYSLGRLFLVSSKQDELSFIESFISTMKEAKDVLVFDVPLWEAKSKNLFSGVTFPVAVGDAFNPSKIIEQQEEAKYATSGYKIVKVPVEFKNEFVRDIVGALRDLAGISVVGLRKNKLFPSEKFILECIDETKLDPVKVHTVNIGLDDETELIWYIDLLKIRLPTHVLRYIHLDISFSGDASSLAMCGVREWRQVQIQKPDGSFTSRPLPVVETDFILRIKAKQADRIPIFQIRKFILDLKTAGFNIAKFTADLRLASEDTLQLLRKAGIPSDYLSVDKEIKAYIDFRNLVYEHRWVCHKHPMLIFELKNLEQDYDTGKINHPDVVRDLEFLEDGATREIVMQGSKDVSDSVVGSIASCISELKMPMDIEVMKDLFRVTRTGSSQIPDVKLPLFDSEGKEITGVKSKDGVKNLADIIKRVRGG